MAEKDKIFKGKVKMKGLFDYKNFYEFLYDYLMDENYDVFERKYQEKVSGDSKDVEIKWECMKEISDYFRFVITLDWLILGMKKVKIKKDDQEISMDTGLLEIKFSALIVKDYENRWENHPFWKFLRGIYDRYIIRTRVEQYQEKLMEEITEYISQIKGLLAIETKHETTKVTEV